jgi:hypothetical protein
MNPTPSEDGIESIEEALSYISNVIDNFLSSMSSTDSSPSTLVVLKGH